ncbi:chromate transporter [Clostridium uliginosum]|uniref:Chromate transporter n=1 Tax=Clostridium uliginosum TaxID=119641 RepID=A0A1I1MHU9_9CLOT|nr:chromate transporter [Clostridium uliginosum]SFC82688.1 chromate transporter [Clostridium uliginosum]
MILTKLFLAFLKIGTFSFGGGYAMIPFIQKEIIDNNSWLTLNEFMDIIGLSQMTPGPIAINSATFVGFKVAGVNGSIFATLGVITTSFILVSIVSRALSKFKDSKVLQGALIGMRPVLIALIIQAFFNLSKEAYIDVRSVIISLIIGGMLLSKKFHPIVSIALSAVLGIIFWSF